ncbi:MAG: hypothetical protein KME29_31400 [Calothrix sp. FI2-JRJ7]|jgi:hypothetical protein|nr:hypothetical protein [Calothrix sp. FI2-JRJ7]
MTNDQLTNDYSIANKTNTNIMPYNTQNVNDQNNPADTILPCFHTEKQDLVVAPEVKLIGREPLKLQFEITQPKIGGKFYITHDKYNHYECINQGDGNFSATQLIPDKEINDKGEIVTVKENGHNINKRGRTDVGLDRIAVTKGSWHIAPGIQDGGLANEYNQGSYCVFAEADEISIEEQWQVNTEFARRTGIVPTLGVHSGGKSIHFFYRFTRKVDTETYVRILKKLVIVFNSDVTITKACQQMRLAGTYRLDKDTYQEVQFSRPEAIYEPDWFEAQLDSVLNIPDNFDERWKLYRARRVAKLDKTEVQKALYAPWDELKPKQREVRAYSSEDIDEATEITLRETGSAAAPLELFLGNDAKKLLFSGVEKGTAGREPTALRLATILASHAKNLDAFGIPYDGDVESLIEDFSERCSEPIGDFFVTRAAEKAWQNAEPAPTGKDYYLGIYQRWALKNLKEEKAQQPDGFSKKQVNDKIKNVEKALKTINANKEEQHYKNLIAFEPVGKHYVSHTRFLSDDVLDKIPDKGLVFVKAPMNNGKSNLIRRILKKHPDRAVLSLIPNTSTAKSQAFDWQLTLRDTKNNILTDGQGNPVKRDGENVVIKLDADNIADALKEAQRLAICYDSLHYIAGKKTKGLILVLDEVVSGLKHLMESSTLVKNGGRESAINCLKELCKNSVTDGMLVIALDAHLMKPMVDFMQAICPGQDIVSITSSRKPKAWNFYQYRGSRSEGYIDDKLIQLISEGKNVWVVTDNQLKGETLERVIKSKFASIPLLRCDSHTKDLESQSRALQDINSELRRIKPQVVIASPTISQGISVKLTKELVALPTDASTEKETADNWENLTPWFDIVIGYNYHLSADKFAQMLGRIRHAVDRVVFVNQSRKIKGCESSFGDEQEKHLDSQASFGDYLFAKARELAPQDTHFANLQQYMSQVFNNIKVGEYPEITLLSQIRAIDAHMQKNADVALLDFLSEIGHNCKGFNLYTKDGVEINELVFDGEKIEPKAIELCDGDNESFAEIIKEQKKEIRQERAEIIVNTNTYGLDFDELLNNQGRGEDKSPQLARMVFEKKYPGLLSSWEKDFGFTEIEEDEPKRVSGTITQLGIDEVDFYREEVIESNYANLTAIRRWVEFQNLDAHIVKEAKKFAKQAKEFKNSKSFALHDSMDEQTSNVHLLHKEILKTFDVFTAGTLYHCNHEIVKEFMAVWKANKKKIEELTKISYNADFTKSITSINKLLAYYGKKLVHVEGQDKTEYPNGRKGKKVVTRYYTLTDIMFTGAIRDAIEESVSSRYTPIQANDDIVETTLPENAIIPGWGKSNQINIVSDFLRLQRIKETKAPIADKIHCKYQRLTNVVLLYRKSRRSTKVSKVDIKIKP